MHDLNETNPRLTLFFSRTTMVLFLCRIKVLGMERNFARNFYIINKNFWSQDLPERGTWVGTTHQGAPPLLARPGGLSPHGGLTDPETDAIKSHYFRKNLGEIIIAIQEMETPSPLVLHQEAKSGVRLGLRRGGSSFFVITNPSPSPIP